MPLYEFKCQKCNETTEEFSSVADRDKSRNCKKCGHELTRITASRVITSIEGYCYNNEQTKVKVS